MNRRAPLLLLTAALWLIASKVQAAPSIELVTMGPGESAFSLFGHAAICVHEPNTEPRCYNYGTADFSQPLQLGYQVLRGEALFWVSEAPRSAMVAAYAADDRTVYSQPLALTDDQAQQLAKRLHDDLTGPGRAYQYHHFRDNCATRLRDHLEQVTGAFSRTRVQPQKASFRQMVRQQLAGRVPLLVLNELVLGREVDSAVSVWEAMFLPDVLRQQVHKQLGSEPKLLYERKQPLPEGNPLAGVFALLLAGAVLSPVVALLAWGRKPWRAQAAKALAVIALLIPALAIGTLALLSPTPEVRQNELLAVFVPFDALIMGLSGKRLKAYVLVRLAGLGLVIALAAAGLLRQPLEVPVVMAALLLAPLLIPRA